MAGRATLAGYARQQYSSSERLLLTSNPESSRLLLLWGVVAARLSGTPVAPVIFPSLPQVASRLLTEETEQEGATGEGRRSDDERAHHHHHHHHHQVTDQVMITNDDGVTITDDIIDPMTPLLWSESESHATTTNTHPSSRATVASLRRVAAVGRVQRALVVGDVWRALDAACEGQQWGLACLLAAKVGPDAVRIVGTAIAQRHYHPDSALHVATLALCDGYDARLLADRKSVV